MGWGAEDKGPAWCSKGCTEVVLLVGEDFQTFPGQAAHGGQMSWPPPQACSQGARHSCTVLDNDPDSHACVLRVHRGCGDQS